MKKKLLLFVALVLGLFWLISSCGLGGSGHVGLFPGVDMFEDTLAWDLINAVRDQSVKDIEKIAKDNPKALNYQAGDFGITPLIWAVDNERYESAKALLKAGADPDLGTTFDGQTPLFFAAGSWYQGTEYIELLLEYGADPNKATVETKEDGVESMIETGKTPLMESISSLDDNAIEKTKALVEGGADIDQKTKYGQTAATYALMAGGGPGGSWIGNLEDIQYARYLIVEKKAKVTEPYYFEGVDETFWPVGDLRDWVFDLESPEQRVKKEIIAEFERQGVDYRGAEITESTLDYIKKTYPDSWQEYIKEY